MSPKRRPGRPSGYTEEIGDQICERLLHESLKEICRDEHMPCFTMVFRWIETNLVFRDQYRRARNAQLEVMADEMITLADTCREGAKTKVTKSLDKDDNEVIHTEIITGDMVERARLQLETRKWLFSKLRPDKYGDRSQVDLRTTVKVDYSKFTTEELEFAERMRRRLEAEAGRVIDVKPEIGAAGG